MSLIGENPRLIPVLQMDEAVSESKLIFENKTKGTRLVLALCYGGTLKTVKNELGFELDLKDFSGYSFLESYTDGQYGVLDNKFHGTTDDGYDVEMRYDGIFRSPVGADTVFEGTKESAKQLYLSTTPRFSIHGKVPKNLEWVLKENFITRGTYTVRDGVRYGQYHMYVIR